MVRVLAVGRHVLHESSSSTVIEEVDGDSHTTATVCGSKTAVEVREKVDLGAIVCALGEDTWNLDTDVWLSVCEVLVEVI